MNKQTFISALCGPALCFFLTTNVARAQDDPGSGGPTPGPAAPGATGVPIDGGASLLLASGVAYGLKRLRDRRMTKR